MNQPLCNRETRSYASIIVFVIACALLMSLAGCSTTPDGRSQYDPQKAKRIVGAFGDVLDAFQGKEGTQTTTIETYNPDAAYLEPMPVYSPTVTY
jgi:hypothetical protein